VGADMRESTTQPKNPRLPINKPHRPIARRGFSDSVAVNMPIKRREVGHGQISVLTLLTDQAEVLAYHVEEEEEEEKEERRSRRCCE